MEEVCVDTPNGEIKYALVQHYRQQSVRVRIQMRQLIPDPDPYQDARDIGGWDDIPVRLWKMVVQSDLF